MTSDAELIAHLLEENEQLEEACLTLMASHQSLQQKIDLIADHYGLEFIQPNMTIN